MTTSPSEQSVASHTAATEPPETLARRAEAAERLLRQLANRTRLMILCLLSEGELSVGEINARVDLSQSALSQHLGQLRAAGVVVTRRQSQTIYYRLVDASVLSLLGSLCELSDRSAKEAETSL